MPMMKAVRSLTEVLVGIALAAGAWTGWQVMKWTMEEQAPVEDIFTAKVLVPDYIVGEDPVIVYDRTIKRTFIGAFSVEVKEPSTVTVCSGAASGIKYDAEEKLDLIGKTLSWYVGDPCAKELKPGSYYLETTYTIEVEGLPVKHLTQTSNIFTVREVK